MHHAVQHAHSTLQQACAALLRAEQEHVALVRCSTFAAVATLDVAALALQWPAPSITDALRLRSAPDSILCVQDAKDMAGGVVPFAAPPTLGGGSMHEMRGLSDLPPQDRKSGLTDRGAAPSGAGTGRSAGSNLLALDGPVSSTANSQCSTYPTPRSFASGALQAESDAAALVITPAAGAVDGRNAWLHDSDSESEGGNPLSCNVINDWAGQSSWVHAFTEHSAALASTPQSAAAVTEATSAATAASNSPSVWQMTEQDRQRAEQACRGAGPGRRDSGRASADAAPRGRSWNLPPSGASDRSARSHPGGPFGRAADDASSGPTLAQPPPPPPGSGFRVVSRAADAADLVHPSLPRLRLPSEERVGVALREASEVCGQIQELFDQLQGHAIMAMQNTATAAQTAASPPPPRPPLPPPPHHPASPGTAAMSRLCLNESPHYGSSSHAADAHFGRFGQSPMLSPPPSPHLQAHFGSAPLSAPDSRHRMHRLDYGRSPGVSSPAGSLSSPFHGQFFPHDEPGPYSARHAPRTPPHRPPTHPNSGPLFQGSPAMSPGSVFSGGRRAPFAPDQTAVMQRPIPAAAVLPECPFCNVHSSNTMSLVAHILSKGAGTRSAPAV